MILPVILAGGSGERLWPLSSPQRPKQFLALTGNESLLVQTVRRVADDVRFAPPMIVAGADHRFLVAEQLRAAGLAVGRIVLEPVSRNTAPPVAAACLLAVRDDPDALVLIMPSDHAVSNDAGFRADVERGLAAARAGRFVLFGIQPTHPASGYGYIQGGKASGEVRQAARFVEKPDEATARALIAAGDHFWNSGVFLLPATGFLEELQQFAPRVLAGARAAVEGAAADADFLRLETGAFAATPSISIDYAVMEKTPRAVMVEARFGWSDVGSWSSLDDLMDKDARGNAVRGSVALEGADGCLAYSDGPPIGLLGVKDVIVVASADGVLVSAKGEEGAMRALVAKLKQL